MVWGRCGNYGFRSQTNGWSAVLPVEISFVVQPSKLIMPPRRLIDLDEPELDNICWRPWNRSSSNHRSLEPRTFWFRGARNSSTLSDVLHFAYRSNTTTMIYSGSHKPPVERRDSTHSFPYLRCRSLLLLRHEDWNFEQFQKIGINIFPL